jgi:predicted transcriptional regulator
VAAAKRKVTISVVPLADMANASRAWLAEGLAASEAGLPFPGAHVAFASTELSWRKLSSKRLALLQAIAGAPPMSIREAARRAGRDVKAVHGDVQVLLDHQLLAKAEDGRIECPYDEIHLDVVLRPLEADAA